MRDCRHENIVAYLGSYLRYLLQLLAFVINFHAVFAFILCAGNLRVKVMIALNCASVNNGCI